MANGCGIYVGIFQDWLTEKRYHIVVVYGELRDAGVERSGAEPPNGHLQDLSALMFDGARFRSLLVNGFDPEAPRCAVRCGVPDYVCGTDGVTYTCGCKDAFCNGVDVVKKGKC
ncbi:hypothetical protein NC651_032110 [Populus alba x Populus x berolinensis]|nr:hypothetical protein NC651_032110 [Populus alba x Populus x berolinensis]